MATQTALVVMTRCAQQAALCNKAAAYNRQLNVGRGCCALQAQAAAVRQVGRGGLDEQVGAALEDAGPSGEPSGEPGHRRADATAVSTAEIVRHPSETEQVLRILATHLRGLKNLATSTGGTPRLHCLWLLLPSRRVD